MRCTECRLTWISQLKLGLKQDEMGEREENCRILAFFHMSQEQSQPR